VIHRLRAFVRRHTPDRRHRVAAELIHEILPLVEMDCRAHEVDLVLELQEDLPKIQVDGIQLQQVLLNLTRNAVEAMNAVEPEVRRLVIRTRALNEDEVELAVETPARACGQPARAAVRALFHHQARRHGTRTVAEPLYH
jgi:C4-dicarboxylate-specific signal transduction histidine kinase